MYDHYIRMCSVYHIHADRHVGIDDYMYMYHVSYYRNNKNHFKEDVKRQVCEQGWKINVSHKIKQTTLGLGY